MALEKKIAAAFLLSLAITLFIGLVSYRNINLFIETNQEVERSYRILAQLENIFSMLKDVEASTRGYILTGDEHFLQPYSGSGEIVDLVSELQQWFRTPRQKTNISELIPLVKKRLALLQEDVDVRTTRGFQPANDLVGGEEGRIVMEQIRKKIEEMEFEENRLLKLRIQEQLAVSQKSVFTIVLGSVLAIAVVLFAFVFIHKDLSARRRTEADSRKSTPAV